MSVPGTFILVDHSLERAFNQGALAQLKVTGPEDKLVYSGKQFDLVYQPEGTGIRVAEQGAVPPRRPRPRTSGSSSAQAVFANNCQACHQANGQGVPDAFPPLAKSDYLNGDKIRAIKTVTGGLEAKLTVNGKELQRRDAGLEPQRRGHRQRADLRLFEVGQFRSRRHAAEVNANRVKARSNARARLTRRALLALLRVAPLAVIAAPLRPAGPWCAPAGLYTPFQRVKPANGAAKIAAAQKPVAAFRLDVEPVTNGEFLAFVAAHPEWRKSQVQEPVRRRPLSEALAVGPRAAGRGRPRRAGDRRFVVRRRGLLQGAGLRLPTTEQWEYALADGGRGQEEVRARSLDWFAGPNGASPAPSAARPTVLASATWSASCGNGRSTSTLTPRPPNRATRMARTTRAFCGGAAAGVSDATDYPAFMRYALRASLKANYTADNLGFRCAGGAP